MSQGGGQSPSGDFFMANAPANLTRAKTIADAKFTPYTGQLAPGVATQLGSATTAANKAAVYEPKTVTAPTANAPNAKAADAGNYQMGFTTERGGDSLAQYLNPYIGQVANQTLAGIDLQRQRALNQNSSGAAMSGAFSNDRLGVENALTNEAYGRIGADALANLYAGGFDKATGLLMTDKAANTQNKQFNASMDQQTNLANQGAQLQTGLANQQAGLTAGLANQQAGLLGANVNLDAAKALGGLGQLQFGQQSAGTNAAYQEFLRQQNDPIMKQNLLNSTLGLIGQTYQWSPSQPIGAGIGQGLASGLGYGLMGEWMK